MLEKLDTLIAFAVVMLGLSLIITILTQMISAALGLRGGNLLWGLETLFKELAPNLETSGLVPKQLAKEILQSELISDSSFSRVDRMRLIGPFVGFLCNYRLTGWVIDRWRYATAIRSEELVRMLQHKIASLDAASAARTQLTNLLAAGDTQAERKLKMLSDALAIVAPARAAAAAIPGQAQPALAPLANYAVQVDKVVQQVIDSTQQSVGKLETWFNSAMDRVAQRFVMQVRVWTVVFAFLLAFGAHLDSLRLLDELSANPETRAALVNIRDGMLGEAKAILPQPAGAAATSELPVSTAILQEALDRLKKADPAVANAGTVPSDLTTVQDASDWLTKQPGVPASAAAEYRKTVLGVLRDHAEKINQDLLKAGLQIIPSPYPGVLTFDGRRNLLGVLLAAAFLSLGAPFWYNALKNLSNLRTVVATKQDQETSAT
jgi:hypothetical protein